MKRRLRGSPSNSTPVATRIAPEVKVAVSGELPKVGDPDGSVLSKIHPRVTVTDAVVSGVSRLPVASIEGHYNSLTKSFIVRRGRLTTIKVSSRRSCLVFVMVRLAGNTLIGNALVID